MERLIILDFGSQYTQLIARRIRELHVFCEIHPYTHASKLVLSDDIRGVILSGSPCSVRDADAPNPDLSHYARGRCRCWACATARSCWPSRAGARCCPLPSASMAGPGSSSLDAASPLLLEHAPGIAGLDVARRHHSAPAGRATTSLPARRKWRWLPSKSKARTPTASSFTPR